MRITHVITRLIVGGAQENTIASVRGLRARPGLDVNLISGPTTGPEGSLEAVCAALGQVHYEAAWTKGRNLTLEQAIDLALDPGFEIVCHFSPAKLIALLDRFNQSDGIDDDAIRRKMPPRAQRQ